MVEDDTGECPACGSAHSDRKAYRARNKEDDIPLGFTRCDFCGSKKCCMCDMGRDVKCLSCDSTANDEDD